LLSVLCEPSLTLPLSKLEPEPEKTLDIFASHITGLDISDKDLEVAIQSTAPPVLSEGDSEAINQWTGALPRWLELKVDIWRGGLEVLNETIAANDDGSATQEAVNGNYFGRGEWGAIVSTEVCVVFFAPMRVFYDGN
jgi:hypothetical protein